MAAMRGLIVDVEPLAPFTGENCPRDQTYDRR